MNDLACVVAHALRHAPRILLGRIHPGGGNGAQLRRRYGRIEELRGPDRADADIRLRDARILELLRRDRALMKVLAAQPPVLHVARSDAVLAWQASRDTAERDE